MSGKIIMQGQIHYAGKPSLQFVVYERPDETYDILLENLDCDHVDEVHAVEKSKVFEWLEQRREY